MKRGRVTLDEEVAYSEGRTGSTCWVPHDATPVVRKVVSRVSELTVRDGDRVDAEQVVARLESADLEAAVTRGVQHMYQNTGQSCNAPSRMLVPAAKLEEAEAIAARVSESVVVGDPKAEGTTMGPVVSEVQFNKIQGLIEAGMEEGAKLVTGGPGRPQGIDKGYFVQPTVFSNANNEMTIAREEIFGPVLTMIPYESEDEAIRVANDTPYGLAGYVQGEDMEHVREVASRIRAGNVHLNGAAGGFDVPFGGFKQSGNGREWGHHGFTDYLEIKAVEGYGS